MRVHFPRRKPHVDYKPSNIAASNRARLLCSSVYECGKLCPIEKITLKIKLKIKFGENISSSCTQLNTENDPNRSIDRA